MSGEFYAGKKFSFVSHVAAADGDTDLLAASGSANETHVLQHLTVTVVLAAAQTFRIEDKGTSPKVFFTAPASLAVGTYPLDFGPLGIPFSAANVALEADVAAAGVQMTVAGYGYIRSASSP